MNQNQLRRVRLAAGLTYREVGHAARLDPSTIAHYEALRLRPSGPALRRWQNAIKALLTERQDVISKTLAALNGV